jgi:cation diffusion facilitator family transporter
VTVRGGAGSQAARGIRAAQYGLLINLLLAIAKLVAGLVGNAYALVADAIESMADVFGSIVVWGGLAISVRPPDADHPYGHGRAEPIAAAAVALTLLGAAIGIVIEAWSSIGTVQDPPAPWTLLVLVGVVIVKWTLAQRMQMVAADIRSSAVRADAWHHLGDAVTSAAAFVGISLALIGTRFWNDPRWAAADDWAAIAASGVIAWNAAALLVPALNDLMDRMPGDDIVSPVRTAAQSVSGVMGVEKLFVRKTGLTYRVTIHVEAEPTMSLLDAHELAHRVQDAIRETIPAVQSAVVHMEPFGRDRQRTTS